MAEYDDLLADLPAPNPEEPASLREDIADELKDHLQCAARREAVSHPDPEEVENRVLARFGNPQKIARRLWFDWMKEILMTQKITLALVAIVAAASLGACGLMWSFARDFQAASAELLTQGRDANRELLKQNRQMMENLTALAKEDDGEPNRMEWVPTKIEVVKQNEARDPGIGFYVALSGFAYSDGEKASLKEETDESGSVDFGLVRPGSYEAFVRAPWGQTTKHTITVKPGVAFVETILAPEGPPREYQLRPVIEWTKWLDGKDVAVLLEVSEQIETTIGEGYWSDRHEEHWLVRQDGRIARYDDRPFPETDFEGVRRMHFRSEPTIIGKTAPSRATRGSIQVIDLIRLGVDDSFPKANDRPESLDEWEPAQSYASQMRRNSQHRRVSYIQPEDSIDADPVQEVKIEIPDDKAASALARLAVDEFSGNSGLVVQAIMAFLKSDANQDLNLSQEEIPSWSEEFQKRIGEKPMSIETFVPIFINSYREQREKAARRAADAKQTD